MSRHWRVLAAVFIVVPSLAQPLPPGPPLSLQEAQALALRADPELSAARLELAAAQAAREQAGLWHNPQLEVQVEGTRRPERETTVVLSQLIELGGKRAARTAAAERSVDIASAQLQAKEAEVRGRVAAAYLQALLAEEHVKFAEATLAAARAATAANARLVAAGKLSPMDETRAQIIEAQAAIELGQARANQRSANAALSAATGADRPIAVSSDANLPLPPAITVDTARALAASSPAVRQATLESERLASLAAVQRAQRSPDLTLSLGAKRLEEPARNQAVIGLAMPLPVLNPNRAAEREALLRADKARDEAAAARLRLQTEAARLATRLDAAREESLALEREVLPAAKRNYDAAVRGFELGKFSFLEALEPQRTYFQVRAQHLKAVGEAHAAAAELARLLGTELP